jgi:hypothetical protein
MNATDLLSPQGLCGGIWSWRRRTSAADAGRDSDVRQASLIKAGSSWGELKRTASLSTQSGGSLEFLLPPGSSLGELSLRKRLPPIPRRMPRPSGRIASKSCLGMDFTRGTRAGQTRNGSRPSRGEFKCHPDVPPVSRVWVWT